MNFLINFFSVLDKIFAATVKAILVAILLVIVGLSAAQVLLRDLFASGISWSDTATHNMVLWLAFLGAILATRKRQHIAIDVITRFIPKAPRNVVRVFLDIFSCIVAFLLARAAYTFVLGERAMGSIAFAQIPAWIVQAIIPLGFILIAMEYAIGVLLDVWRIAHPALEESEASKTSEGGLK